VSKIAQRQRAAGRIAALASIETNVPSMIDGEAVVLGVDRIADFYALHSRKHDD
jgi:ATP-dependent DNA ligase